ncbi:MAG: restriction endonuclease subunit S [Flavobacterium sp.]|nr:restriction endonuclease subunit S [Flavobacterium sp.]
MKSVDFNEVIDFLEGPGVRNWQFTDSGIKLINIRNIVNDKINLENTTNYLSEEEVSKKYNHFLLKEGDYIMASSGVTWGKIAEVKKEHLPLCLNTSIIKLRPKDDNFEKKYLWYFIKSNIFTKQIDKIITGSAQPNFGPSHLKKVKIPLPPLPQQQKIANILDAADALRQNDKALIAKYDELTQSLFLDMFGDYLNGKLYPLKDLVRFSQGQQFGVEQQLLEPKEGYARFLRIVDYTQGEDLRFVPNRSIKYYVNKEDIVMVRYGASAGFVGTNKEGVLANNLFKVNYDKVMFNQAFLFFIFQNERFKKFVNKEAFGAAMPALSFKVMERFEIPVPPLNIQNQFAERVTLIEAQKAVAQASLVKSDELFNSLLQKAFKGELV